MRIVDSAPDEPGTALLLEQYFGERVEGFPDPQGYRTTRPDPAQFVAPGAFLRVEEDDGAPVACGGVRPLPEADGRRPVEVKHLFVAPAGRGRGLGRTLLTELERRARAAGATHLVLDTNRSLTAAAGLYASFGFEPVAPFNDNPNATDWFLKALGSTR